MLMLMLMTRRKRKTVSPGNVSERELMLRLARIRLL
jgi:hypothetical protein